MITSIINSILNGLYNSCGVYINGRRLMHNSADEAEAARSICEAQPYGRVDKR